MQAINLKRLMAFYQVINNGSFTAAAKRLNLPRSSISQQVTALEKSMGIKLMLRTTRKLSLTHEGSEIFMHAQRMHKILSEIDAISVAKLAAGTVTVAVTSDVAAYWLLPRLKQFNTLQPNIKVRLLVDEFTTDLVGEQVDLALRIAPVGKDFSLVGRTLAEETVLFFASTAYLSINPKPITLDSLQAHRWILLKQLSPTGELPLYVNKQKIQFKPMQTIETDSPYIAHSLILQGFGIGTALESILKVQAGKVRFERVLSDAHSVKLQISLVYPSRQLPLRTRLLADYLHASGW